MFSIAGRKPISTTRGVQHRPRDAAAEEAKISTGEIGELREQNRLYIVGAFTGGAFVFVSIFVVACLLSFRRKRRIQEPTPLHHGAAITSPTTSRSTTGMLYIKSQVMLHTYSTIRFRRI